MLRSKSRDVLALSSPTLRSETSFGGAIFGTYPLISFQAGVHGGYTPNGHVNGEEV